jgi:hypothetical protein
MAYWIVYALFVVVDFAGNPLSSFFPYFVLKTLFLVFLMHPWSFGAVRLYDSFNRESSKAT